MFLYYVYKERSVYMFTGWMQPLRDLLIKPNLIYLGLRVSLYVLITAFLISTNRCRWFVCIGSQACSNLALFDPLWFNLVRTIYTLHSLNYKNNVFHVMRIRNAKIKSQLFMSRNQRIKSANISFARQKKNKNLPDNSKHRNLFITCTFTKLSREIKHFCEEWRMATSWSNELNRLLLERDVHLLQIVVQ